MERRVYGRDTEMEIIKKKMKKEKKNRWDEN